MDELHRQTADDFLRRVARDPAYGRGDIGEPPVGTHLGHQVIGVLGQHPIAVAGPFDRAQSVRIVGDVLQQAEQRRDLAVVVQLAQAAGHDVAQVAVQPDQLNPQVEAALLGDGARDALFEYGAVFGRIVLQRALDRRGVAVAAQTEDPERLVRPGQVVGGDVDAPVADLGDALGQLQQALLLGRLAVGLGQLELIDDDAGQQLQALQLVVGRAGAGLVVDHAQRAEVVAVLRGQGRAGVEADVGRAGHQRVGGEAWI